MNDYFVLDVCHDAMIYDGIHTFHGMTSTVNTPEEINGKFDIISYDKGNRLSLLNFLYTSDDNIYFFTFLLLYFNDLYNI